MIKAIIIGLILAVLTVGAFSMIGGGSSPQGSGGLVVDPGEANRIMVSIEGEILRPGTYSVEPSATLRELFSVGGGLTANADRLAFYDDIVLESKVSYYIAPKYNNGDVCSALPIEKVNVNSASAEQLMSINGISTSLSQSIISYRQAEGSFDYLEEIMEVSGIGSATYKKIRDFIILHDA